MPVYHIPLNELQTALYSRLGTILGSAIGVYDQPVEHADFPYVLIGDFTVEPDGTKTSGDVRIVGTVHIYSDKAGFKETQDIANDIVAELTNYKLTLTGGYTTYPAFFERFTAAQEYTATGALRHGHLELRWLIV